MGCVLHFINALFLIVLSGAAILLAAFPLFLSSLIAPRKNSSQKQKPYECGLESKGEPWIQFRIQYYLIALLFVIFDVEVVFMIPWATAFKQLPQESFSIVFLFITLLGAGLAYAWKKKDLEWK